MKNPISTNTKYAEQENLANDESTQRTDRRNKRKPRHIQIDYRLQGKEKKKEKKQQDP